ncbi:hypothetical protein HanIR_Chr11g0546051 [Helianthus annuus]|nr:hypothetical protein HanIR_Chr11g0546051 [Helianthus annuus]
MLGKEKIDTAERSYNADVDSSTLKRDRGKKDTDRSTGSRTPERSTRRHHDSEYSEMNSDKSGSYRRKDLEKDSYRDERSRGRDDSWKRRQETKDGDAPYDYTRDWESPSQRRGRDRDRVDTERHMGRNRTYDVIEIELKLMMIMGGRMKLMSNLLLQEMLMINLLKIQKIDMETMETRMTSRAG